MHLARCACQDSAQQPSVFPSAARLGVIIAFDARTHSVCEQQLDEIVYQTSSFLGGGRMNYPGVPCLRHAALKLAIAFQTAYGLGSGTNVMLVPQAVRN